MQEGYKSLTVWQKSMDLVVETYSAIDHLPVEERFGLADQMRRSCVSIASNIAEGSKRSSKKEFAHFLQISHGSLAELETQLILVNRLHPLIDVSKCLSLCSEVGRMLYTLIQKQGAS